MKALKFAVIFLVFSQAGYAQFVKPPRICTRDINQWGHPSRCSCPEGYKYNPMNGFCVNKSAKTQQLTLTGVLRTNIMAIGGETTGTILQTESGNYDLILHRKDARQTHSLDGKKVSVVGLVVAMEGVEIKGRKAIIVQSLASI